MESTRHPAPAAQLLSNGRYRVLVTEAGGGYAALDGLALTRWTADPTHDADGVIIYVRDLESGAFWSVGHQAEPRAPGRFEVRFDPGNGTATVMREDDGIATRLDLVVAEPHNLEFRRLTLTNRGDRPRRLEVTTYAEPVLTVQAADIAHPAFSKLFIETALLPGIGALLARRRARSLEDPELRLAHALVGEGAARGGGGGGLEPAQYETDRERFIGRGRTLAAPAALTSGAPLSGTVGHVLDPVLSLRRTVVLEPGGTERLIALFAAGPTDAAAADLVTHGSRPGSVDEAVARAARRARGLLRRLGFTDEDTGSLPRVSGAIAYGMPPAGTRRFDGSSSADFAALGLPPGVPFLSATVRTPDDLPTLRAATKALAWWRAQGSEVTLLVLRSPALADDGRVAEAVAALDGHVSVRSGDELPARLRPLALDAAQILHRESDPAPGPATLSGVAVRRARPASELPREPSDTLFAEPLRLFNGYGGFSADGTEYVIRRLPPLPWINVVANEQAGFLVSESGAGVTWSLNSRENRLTPWFNDPVMDPHGEALYLRDDEAGVFWSPTPGPAPGAGDYEVRHGFGYTRFRHHGLELEQELVLFVPAHDPVKLAQLRLTNRSDRPRRLTLFSYAEWVLGARRHDTARFVVTERDRETGAILAHNPAADEYAGRVALAALAPPPGAGPVQATADRRAFLGPHGSPAHPAAVVGGVELDDAAGPGLDACAAFRVSLRLGPGESVECGVLLGQAESRAAALELARRYRDPATLRGALEDVRRSWRHTLTAVQIDTPSPAIDLMVNGWLAYQNLSCRLWGRTALYQSGGAFGFRDQLQDAAALLYLDPALTRRQILLHAAHQFPEGDVLHWWHPPTSKGIRTGCSDDRLWLPYVTAFYVEATGDASLLDEERPFVRARQLHAGEDEAFVVPEATEESATVYAHCCRAVDRALSAGRHGLPLMGTGDWNDGMNRVGRQGKGESVWLGFFLYAVLEAFVPLCQRRGDRARAARYRARQAELEAALNGPGWDGAWYRRAYYDDGTPLGSAASDECRIDALAQAWAALAGAAPPERVAQALTAAEQQLVNEEIGIIRLLTPPFDRTRHDPGYIKGYLPGVRENGGQYTHAALWVVAALAALGRTERAARLLEMLSPVYHARAPDAVAVYRVEPYVVAADVYGVDPHLGRGGWTWYTGSAGWMFRVALESILGARLRGGSELVIHPRLPPQWPGYTLRYRLPPPTPDEHTTYEIIVRRAVGGAAIAAAGPGARVEDDTVRIALLHDGGAHRVVITVRDAAEPRPQ